MNKYLATLRIHYLEAMQYRFDILGAGIVNAIYAYTMAHIWKAIYQNNTIAGFTLIGIIWYALIAQVMRTIGGRPVKSISESIQEGTAVNLLNKPLNYMWFQAATEIGKHLPAGMAGLALASIIIGTSIGTPQLQWITLPLALLTVAAGILINYLLAFCIATAAFRIEDAKPLHWIYDKLIFILGGFLFPLEVLPTTLQNIASNLPTAYFIYYPAKLIVHYTPELFIKTITGQAISITALILLGNYLLKRGIKHVNHNGG